MEPKRFSRRNHSSEFNGFCAKIIAVFKKAETKCLPKNSAAVIAYNRKKFKSPYEYFILEKIYTKTTVISHIREKHISAVLISGKYIVPKSALVDFIVSDIAFEIVNKSPWHMNTILLFVEKK